MSLKVVPHGPTDNKLSLVQMMAWYRTGDSPFYFIVTEACTQESVGSEDIFFMKHVTTLINTSRLRQNGRHFPDDIFKCIIFSKNVWVSIDISLKFVPKGQIDNIPALVKIMAWCRAGDKPLSEPMLVRLSMHIYMAWPQWAKNMKMKKVQYTTHVKFNSLNAMTHNKSVHWKYIY